MVAEGQDDTAVLQDRILISEQNGVAVPDIDVSSEKVRVHMVVI